MNTNWIGGTRERSARREHPTQRGAGDRHQGDEPPAEYYERQAWNPAGCAPEPDFPGDER